MLLDRKDTDGKHIDLVLFAGQSNMSGHGTAAEARRRIYAVRIAALCWPQALNHIFMK